MPEKKKSSSIIIELNSDLIRNNDLLAEDNNQILKNYNIKVIEIVGAIGAGKTAILECLVKLLGQKYPILVINGDVTTRIDASRIETLGVETVQINTGRECSLNAYHINQVIKNKNLDEYRDGILFIENVGNLICPSDFILGADLRIMVVSITEGEWVIEKHPLLAKMAQIIVINKIDLLDVVPTNIKKMKRDAYEINPNARVLTTSAFNEDSIKQLSQIIGL